MFTRFVRNGEWLGCVQWFCFHIQSESITFGSGGLLLIVIESVCMQCTSHYVPRSPYVANKSNTYARNQQSTQSKESSALLNVTECPAASARNVLINQTHNATGIFVFTTASCTHCQEWREFRGVIARNPTCDTHVPNLSLKHVGRFWQ